MLIRNNITFLKEFIAVHYIKKITPYVEDLKLVVPMEEAYQACICFFLIQNYFLKNKHALFMPKNKSRFYFYISKNTF